MTLEIIGVGFGRTGTDSTREALNLLGYPCYHMREVLRNPKNKSHLGFWIEVANAEAGVQHDWSRVFASYRATVDNPAACVWRELLEAYPEAKVLLTLHPGGPDSWYESTVETIYAPERMWQARVLELFTPFGRRFMPMARKLIWGRFYENTLEDRAAAIELYNRHIEDVKAAVAPDRLLIFDVSEGWQPLCDFLGGSLAVPVPDEDFPRINDRATTKKMIAGIILGAYVVLGVGALLLAAVIAALAALVL